MKQTPLKSFDLPHLDLVLDEIFAIPPAGLLSAPPPPTTVEELAARRGRPVEEVAAILTRIADMSQGLEITPDELAQRLAAAEDGLLLLDVREPWEFETARLAGSILLAGVDFAALLPRLQEAATVVTICHHGVRSYSAALWLRERGVTGAVSLAGGLDLWAARIDPDLPRY